MLELVLGPVMGAVWLVLELVLGPVMGITAEMGALSGSDGGWYGCCSVRQEENSH